MSGVRSLRVKSILGSEIFFNECQLTLWACESRACYVFHFSTRFNAILVVGGNGCAIESNWGDKSCIPEVWRGN